MKDTWLPVIPRSRPFAIISETSHHINTDLNVILRGHWLPWEQALQKLSFIEKGGTEVNTPKYNLKASVPLCIY